MLKNFKYFLYYLEYQTFIDNNIKLLPKLLYCKENDDLLFDNLVFSKQYLRTIALEDGIISFNIWQTMDTDLIESISYSLDNGNTWHTYDNEDNKSNNFVISVGVSAGDKILWKGIGTQTGFYDGTDYYGSFFSSTCYMNVDGNVMSLLYGDDFVDENNLNYNGQFAYLFCDKNGYDSTSIMHAGNLYLPYTIQGKNYFNSIFKNTNPITKPILLHTNFEGITYTKELPKQFEKWQPTLEVDNDKIFLPSTVRIIMGNLEITDSCYNFEKNVIIIDNVTDDIEITASAVTLDSTLTDSYEILTYIGCITKESSPGLRFTTISSTEKSRFYTSLNMKESSSYLISEPSKMPSSSSDRPAIGAAEFSTYGWWIWARRISGGQPKFTRFINKRMDIDINKGFCSVECKTVNTKNTLNMYVEGETFTGGNVTILGNTTSTSAGAVRGDVYSVMHWSDDVLTHNYVPVKRKSDKKVGMLDINGSNSFIFKNSTNWIAPYITITNTYTNCMVSRLSTAETGFASYMVIGKEWQFKYTPNVDYTFRSDAFFRVLVNNVDVTSTAAVYDSTTDSYTVTLTAHWNDDVKITAIAATYALYTVLDGVELSNVSLPMLGSSYSTGFTISDNTKQLLPSTVRVYMSKVDVTDSVYNFETNTIIIPEVTGAIDIYAESDVVDSAYKPLLYTCNLNDPPSADNGNIYNNHIELNYKPNSKTNLDLNVLAFNNRAYTLLISTKRSVNGTGTATDGQFAYWKRLTNTNYSSLYWGSQAIAEGTYSMKPNIKNNVVIKNGSVTYIDTNNAIRTKTVSNPNEVWTCNNNLVLFSGMAGTSYPYYSMAAAFYDMKVSEDGELLHNWIAVERLSDNACGLYDIITGTYTNAPVYITPYVNITIEQSNCSNTMLSSNSGNLTHACIGKSWSSKFTPASGYTFNDSNAVFTVTINNVDMTSTISSYDSSTDTWTVTLTAHWKDAITITATAITTV